MDDLSMKNRQRIRIQTDGDPKRTRVLDSNGQEYPVRSVKICMDNENAPTATVVFLCPSIEPCQPDAVSIPDAALKPF